MKNHFHLMTMYYFFDDNQETCIDIFMNGEPLRADLKLIFLLLMGNQLNTIVK